MATYLDGMNGGKHNSDNCIGTFSTKKKVNLNKHIWEGWTVQNFIDELTLQFDMIMSNNSWQKPFKDKDELKEWCKSNQPGYKKHIPEVYNHFLSKTKLK